MGNYKETFEWIDFPQGRVRYAGGRRGKEEPAIETFAVEVYGRIYYGEIRRSFLVDRNNYNLEVISFGWLTHDWYGTEPDSRYCAAFTINELGEVQALLCQAVPVWRSFDARPPFLTEYVTAHFMGEVIFRDGWALTRDEGGM